MTLLDYSSYLLEPQKQEYYTYPSHNYNYVDYDANYGYGYANDNGYSCNYDYGYGYEYDYEHSQSEAELLCFDDPNPPSLLDLDFNPNPTLNNLDPLIIPPPPPLPLLPQQDYYSYNFVQHFGDAPFPKKHCVDINDNVKVEREREVSTQSKAARERRRRITEKTQELGKLVPGGSKMNTAEMFQAAANYVKFMQAQLGLLNTLQSLPKESVKDANLNNLPILGSPLIQEKLYAKEKCLFPIDFLPILKEHLDFEENPSISKDINDLIIH